MSPPEGLMAYRTTVKNALSAVVALLVPFAASAQSDRPAPRAGEPEAAQRDFTATAIARLAPAEQDSTGQFAFAVDRPTDLEIVASGEVRAHDAPEYGWGDGADTRHRR